MLWNACKADFDAIYVILALFYYARNACKEDFESIYVLLGLFYYALKCV